MPELRKFKGRDNELMLIPGNREPKPRKDLLRSMSKWGCQSQVQIIKTNLFNPRPGVGTKKLYIIDGQHRAAEAAALDIDFYGVILDFKPRKESEIRQLMIDLNNTSRNWNIKTYVRNFSNLGNKHYKELEKIKENSVYSMNTIAILLSGGKTSSGSLKAKLNEGKFKIVDREGALKTLDLAAKLSLFGVPNISMVIALNEVRKQENYNETKFTTRYKLEYPNLRSKNVYSYITEFKSYLD